MKKKLVHQFCARCGAAFSRFKVQTYCSVSCSSLARGERGKRGLQQYQLDERYTCIVDPSPCHGAGFRGMIRSLEGWLPCKDGLVLENFRGEQITLPNVTTRRRAEPHTAPLPETAVLSFGHVRAMPKTYKAARIG